MDLLLDLHNPGAGARRESIYVTSSNLVSAAIAQRQDRFVNLLREEFPGLGIVDDKPNPADPNDLKIWRDFTTTWLQDRANPQTICFAVETPWNTTSGTVAGYRDVGQKLGLVLERYLHAPERR